MHENHLSFWVYLVIALFFLPVLASAKKFGDYESHGFLSDYSQLKPEANNSKAFIFSNDSIDKRRYKKVMVDRIKVFLKKDIEYKGIDPAELHELVQYFHKAIENTLGNTYPIVSEPGPDVIRLRIAVTDLVPNKPEASVVSLVVPFLWLGEASAGVAQDKAGSTPFLGEATVEIEALDSLSNQQIAAFIEERIGKKYNWVAGVKTGVTDYMKAYSTWDYTKQAMDHWASFIKTRLDRAHGINEP